MMNNLVKGYTSDIKKLCDNLDFYEINKVFKEIEDAYDNRRKIFIAGNGGSAGTSNHFSCDFSKNAIVDDTKRAKLITLSSNVEYITAIGNDIGYEWIFTEQLKNLMEDGDLIILISASGNSPNIVNVAEYVKERNGKVIAFTGFSGGKLKGIADLSVNVNSDSYEKIEDIHMILMHIIVCHFKSLFAKDFEKICHKPTLK